MRTSHDVMMMGWGMASSRRSCRRWMVSGGFGLRCHLFCAWHQELETAADASVGLLPQDLALSDEMDRKPPQRILPNPVP